MRKPLVITFLVLILLCLAAVLLYNIPPIHERLAWRVTNLTVQVRRFLNPPEQQVFTPKGQSDPGVVQTLAKATLDALLPAATSTVTPGLPSPVAGQTTATATSQPTATPTLTPVSTATPIPGQNILAGVVHEYQQFNNCGPANLAMALSFWGWGGDQNVTRAYLRPNPEVDDKNVMPSEMVAYVNTYAGLRALTRIGGDLTLLKQFIAAGFPMLIEKGHDPQDDWWMGHYMVINGYDDQSQRLTAQDSLSNPDISLPYDQMAEEWRDFNYVYIVIYPAERENEVLRILGPHADPAYNFDFAAQRANQEITTLQDRNLFFAWFNLGSSLVGLEKYPEAAQAFDQAFALYARLPEDKLSPDSRPYRLMWYQIGPYQAYYNSGRYQDVVDLANTTLMWVSQPILEETYYWRGLAFEALDNQKRAISDYQKAAALNPNYAPPREALQRLGVELP